MKKKFFLLAIPLLLLSCNIPNMTVIELESKNSSNVTGNVVFIEEGENINMIATINNLNPGKHAIHIHEKSDCSSDDGKSSGGHWNPTLTSHGKWGDQNGFHIGDIGNFTANEQGVGTINFSTELWCLDCDDVNKNIMGKAIIVHEGIDDFITQPSGAAGSRITCGGIILKNAILNSKD
ncbi:MAG: superoxide dismutase family protein [Flavobacteriales bacterium]|jgi:Cu-Zn family superoxide dismutase|tara:strand:+ start:911 stop:1447 length:537 start_codon:yes stop_codon:yes gene_type:complete